jgi:hypothetical protein
VTALVEGDHVPPVRERRNDRVEPVGVRGAAVK